MAGEESSHSGNNTIFSHARGTQINGGTFITVQVQNENDANPSRIASITDVTDQFTRNLRVEPRQSLLQDIPEWKVIHQRCTGRLRLGNALWDPSPDRQGTPQSYQRRGPQIGDVGMLSREGNFRYNFNIGLSANHSDNALRVPARFQPWSGPLEIQMARTGGSLTERPTFALSRSSNWNETDKYHEITYTTSSLPTEGVLIFVGDGLESKQLNDSGPESAVASWTQTQAYDWYKHFMSRQLPVANGDLQVVIGTEKTSYWLTATFSELVSNVDDFSFTVKYYPDPTSNMNTRCLYGHNGAFWTHVMTGPDEAEVAALRVRPNQTLKNQAMFVKTLTVTLSEDEWAQLRKEVMLKSPSGRAPPRHGPSLSRASAPAPRGSKSTQANALAKKSQWTPIKRPLGVAPSNIPASTTLIMTFDEAYPSSEDDYGQTSEFSPVSGDDRMPDDKLENPNDQQSRWIGVENHPSRLLNKRLIKEAPTAKLAITSDDDWIRVIREDDEVQPDPEVLVARILASHDIVVKNSMVFVRPRTELEHPVHRYVQEYPMGSAPR